MRRSCRRCSRCCNSWRSFCEARQCGITRITCRLRHRNEVHTDCVVRLAQPEAAAARFGMVCGTLEQDALPGPVRSLELRSGELLSRAPVHESLWQPGEHGGGGKAGTARFAGIHRTAAHALGRAAVHGLICQDSHCPEGGLTALSPADPQFRRARRCDAQRHAGARPLWLLEEPQRLREQAGWPQLDGPLRLRHGPERIESEWWEAQGIARDYYHATDVHGIAVWVFREREPPHRWFLHGFRDERRRCRAYAELHCLSHFTFLRGASRPASWCSGRSSWDTAHWPSPMSVPWRAWCARIWRSRTADRRLQAHHRRGVHACLWPEVRGPGDQSPGLCAAVRADHPRPARRAEGQLPPDA